MPLYEFRCRSCGSTFEELRTADRSDEVASCPDGHTDTVRLLSMIAKPAGGSPSSAPMPMAGGGGGCCGGGGCGC